MIPQPVAGDNHPYYDTYISKVEGDVMALLDDQSQDFSHLMESLSDKDLAFSYGEGKWTLRQVFMHIIDAERVFAYRAMCISRGEKGALPGFDQNEYMDNTDYSHLSTLDILREFNGLRASTISLVQNLSETQIRQKGTASDSPVSVNALIYIIAGHFNHHMEIIKARYLKAS